MAGGAAPSTASGGTSGLSYSTGTTDTSTLAYSPYVPPGTLTVIQPPPPLLAVPPTPNTAPIQYETGQNGGTIGIGLIGGGGGFGPGYGGSGTSGTTAPGTGIFSQNPPNPSGVFSSLNQTGAPNTGTPGAPQASTPTFGSGAGFASSGIPATPQVLNNGTGGTGVVLTPQPLNGQPALTPGTTLPGGPTPALPGTNPVTGQPQLSNQLPAQTQLGPPRR
jgi:hypothetical protein